MRRTSLLSTTVGRKFLIGLTGLLLFAFLVLHLIGNLLFFFGPVAFNTYSYILTATPLVTAFEFGLALVFLLHIYLTVTMWWEARQARPVKYHKKQGAGGKSRKSLSSATMICTGPIVFAFAVIHLRQFKYGPHIPTVVYGRGMRDLYQLEMMTFHNPWIVAFYVLSMVVIGFHLWHGFWSATQSLGTEDPGLSRALYVTGQWVSVILAGMFLFIPLAVYVMSASYGVAR
jgi:succinate dehydrogenase / fumarate reductase cytochrome b subunit